MIDRYAADHANLKRHSDRYPEPDALRRITTQGATESSTGSGIGRSTAGSAWIVQSARRNDPRPLWVLVWGGPNCLAQALWKLRATRPPDALQRVVAKLRVYTISDQDDSGPWLRKTFPGLFYIASPGCHPLGGYHHMGTTRMADDPKRGVTDHQGRVHGFGNLYVAGSSLFPTGGWANPTLTIVALALRTADHLASSAELKG